MPTLTEPHRAALGVLSRGGSIYEAIDAALVEAGLSSGPSRSVPQHRRFFAFIRAAYTHWPEKHPFQPDNSEHLRKWLLIKAKHRVINEYHVGERPDEFARLLPIISRQMLGTYCWAWTKDGVLYVCTAKSIAFDKASHAEFTRLVKQVEDVFRSETGIDPDKLMAQAEDENDRSR